MQIPNSIIHIRTENGVGYGPLICPAYEAIVLRKVYSGRLASERGLEVTAYPADGNEDTRYTETNSADAEMSRMRNKYRGDSRGYFVDQALTAEQLETEIVKLIEAEATRIESASKPKIAPVAHKSYLDANVSAALAVALQEAGYATREDCVGKKLLDISNVPGMDAATASRLIKPVEKKAEK